MYQQSSAYVTSDAVPVVVPSTAKVPPHLMGTRAGLFHLLRATAAQSVRPVRPFARTTVPEEAGPVSVVHSETEAKTGWRDILQEDVFLFRPSIGQAR